MDIQVLLIHLTMVPVSENAEQCKVNMNAKYYTVMLETILQNALHPPQLDLLGFYSTDFHACPQDNVCRQTHLSLQGHHLACLLD